MYKLDEQDEKIVEQERNKTAIVVTILFIIAMIIGILWVINSMFLKVEPEWAENKPKQEVAIIMDTYLNAERLAYKINSTGVALAEPWDSCDSYATAHLINPNVLGHTVFIIHQNAKDFGGPECIDVIRQMKPEAQFICVFITKDSRFFRDCPGGKIEYTHLMGLPTFGDILPR